MNTKKIFETVCTVAHTKCPEIFTEYNEIHGQIFSGLCSGSSFLRFWLEIPLNESHEKAKIDLHVLFSKDELADIKNFHSDFYGYRSLFEWFSEYSDKRNEIALLFDMADDNNSMTCAGTVLNVNSGFMNDAEKFLELSNYPEGVNLFHDTINLIPQDWHTWYIASITGREKKLCRVDSYISKRDAERYADEPDLFSRQLRTFGYSFDTERIKKFVSWFSKLKT